MSVYICFYFYFSNIFLKHKKNTFLVYWYSFCVSYLRFLVYATTKPQPSNTNGACGLQTMSAENRNNKQIDFCIHLLNKKWSPKSPDFYQQASHVLYLLFWVCQLIFFSFILQYFIVFFISGVNLKVLFFEIFFYFLYFRSFLLYIFPFILQTVCLQLSTQPFQRENLSFACFFSKHRFLFAQIFLFVVFRCWIV